SWVTVSPTGIMPPATADFSMVTEGRDKLVVFGGQDTGTSDVAEIWRFNHATDEWTRHQPTGIDRPKMYNAATTLGDGRAYSLGGISYESGKGVNSVLYALDLEQNSWSELPAIEAYKSVRQGTLNYIKPKNILLAIGGSADTH